MDDANGLLKEVELDKEKMNQEIKEAQDEVEYYKNKHDEMFSSVSALNARIEELEQHKMHLLNKLKDYGDTGGLDYIVKT